MNAGSENAKLEEIFDEILIWIKLMYSPVVSDSLAKILDTKQKKRVYEATDGHNSTRDIAAKLKVNKNTVSEWWKEWSRHGLLQPGPERQDRPQKIISLKRFGLI